ncbi:MAG: phosphoadenylyl-sulfate reductase, partial [Saprospiraceae bacterium]
MIQKEQLIGLTDPKELLKVLGDDINEKVVFSTSLSIEDQVITDMIFRHRCNIKIFTLDTGRMYPETYETLDNTLKKYRQPIEIYFPDAEEVEAMVRQKGPFSFYDSLENRKECCEIRKVKPLKRALAGHTIWITGIRTAQSQGRSDLQKIEWDEANQITKVHPLLDWSDEQVWTYIEEYKVPFNPLFNEGFLSIGCQPCTRAVNAG